MSKVYHNGKVINEKDISVTHISRAFRYADGIFETIRLINGKTIFIDNHLKRIKNGLEILKISIPEILNEEGKLEKIITDLAKKNGIERGGVARLIVWRNSDGRYMPENDDNSYLIEVSPYEDNLFALSKSGKSIDIYLDMRKQVNILSPYKMLGSQLNVMAAVQARNKGLDDNLISNEDGMIIESTNSNLFIVSNGTIYTPPLEDGCVGGTMRMNVINAALEINLSVYESSLNQQHLLMANEILLSNAITGIDWVNAFKHKRYYSSIATKLLDQLNKNALNL
jgi:branched-chain amino acid aminotransferase